MSDANGGSGGNGDARPYRDGVGIMLVNGAGRVWVGRRLDTRGDAWQMPQGGIDPGETPRQAVLRELAEETGSDKAEIVAESRDWHAYDLPDDLTRKVWNGKYRGQRQKWFLLRFTGDDGDIRLDASARPEFGAWKWTAVDDLPRQIVPFKRAIYEAVIDEFRASLDSLRPPA